MKRARHTCLVFALLLCIAPLRVNAEPHVSAKVNATETTVNSPITLTIEVTGVSNIGGSPNINIPDFEVQKAGQTQSFQWINGQTSSMIAFNYILRPTRTGTLKIPPISMFHDGKNYATEPISINVANDAAPSAQTAQGSGFTPRSVQVPSEGLKPIFLTANVDTNKVYVGQQILLKVQFLRRPDVRLTSQPRYVEPDMTGFVVESMNQQEFTTNINGTQYDVTELRYALFPTSDGEFAVGSATIELSVRADVDPFDPNSFFQSFFGQSQGVKLNTRAIPVQVRALPKNKPMNYSGAVGRFKISSKVDSNDPEVGKPLNLLVTVEGVGNIKAIKEPEIMEMSGFRRYETISSAKVDKDGKFLHGSKEFKILLIPQVSGQITIPPIAFSYFNPNGHEYETTITDEISLKVKAGTISQAEPDAPQRINEAEPSEGVKVVEKDIRFIKSGDIKPMSSPIYRRGGFFVLNAIPPLFAMIALMVRWHSKNRLLNAGHYRSKNALKKALKSVSQAQKLMLAPDPASFYGALHSAVSGYLADKLSISALGMVWDYVKMRLEDKGASEELLVQIKNLFDEADMARFATSSFTDQIRESSLRQSNSILIELDKVFERKARRP